MRRACRRTSSGLVPRVYPLPHSAALFTGQRNNQNQIWCVNIGGHMVFLITYNICPPVIAWPAASCDQCCIRQFLRTIFPLEELQRVNSRCCRSDCPCMTCNFLITTSRRSTPTTGSHTYDRRYTTDIFAPAQVWYTYDAGFHETLTARYTASKSTPRFANPKSGHEAGFNKTVMENEQRKYRPRTAESSLPKLHCLPTRHTP